MRRPYKAHLANWSDLVSSYEQIRAGFIALALERNRRATPFVEQARALKAVASRVATPAELLTIPAIEPALLTAAGISDKAAIHLQPQDKAEAIQGLLRNYLEPAGAGFVEELVYRFLLTRGDTLGGSMRNAGGALAQRRFTRAIVAALTLMQIKYKWLSYASKEWTLGADSDDVDIEFYVNGLSWADRERARTLLYNRRVPLVRSNIDLILLTGESQKVAPDDPRLYIALGELKGGIDPAGADEHWKTASSALSRSRDAFTDVG
ncbi:MAG: restriction endonuclease, partial [Synergistales bacterium]|nr:restriction endonuclease [Synergistales bacterium]